jgi:hypothetical protein
MASSICERTNSKATPQYGLQFRADHRVPVPLEILACKPVSVACEPGLWPRLPRAPGNGFRMPETEGSKLPPSGPSSLQRLEADLCARAKSRVFGERQEISFSAGVRGGGCSLDRTCLHPKFPAIYSREFSREFFEKGFRERFSSLKRVQHQLLIIKFPAQKSREFFCWSRECWTAPQGVNRD